MPSRNWTLKTTEIYSFAVLKLGSPKSSCWQGHAPLKALGKNLPCFFPASGVCQLLHIPWFLAVSLQFLPISSHGHFPSVHVSLSLNLSFYKDTSHWIYGPLSSSIHLCWLYVTSANTLTSNKVTFTGTRGLSFNISCRGTQLSPQNGHWKIIVDQSKYLCL